MPTHTNHEGFVTGSHGRTWEITYRGERGEALTIHYPSKNDDEELQLHNASVEHTIIRFQLADGELYLVRG